MSRGNFSPSRRPTTKTADRDRPSERRGVNTGAIVTNESTDGRPTSVGIGRLAPGSGQCAHHVERRGRTRTREDDTTTKPARRRKHQQRRHGRGKRKPSTEGTARIKRRRGGAEQNARQRNARQSTPQSAGRSAQQSAQQSAQRNTQQNAQQSTQNDTHRAGGRSNPTDYG